MRVESEAVAVLIPVWTPGCVARRTSTRRAEQAGSARQAIAEPVLVAALAGEGEAGGQVRFSASILSRSAARAKLACRSSVPVRWIFSWRSMIDRIICSGRGGQPGTYTSTGMKRSIPCTTA